MTNRIIKKDIPDRSKINMQRRAEAKCWARQLGVSHAQLRAIVDKVGNSASAVRKEIASR
jgi:hypothetical protein